MKKIKKLLFVLVCFISCFLLTGCGNKDKITIDDFKSVMESKGYVVEDITSSMSEYGYITKTLVAKLDTHKIEFYVLKDVDSAVTFFNTNKTSFENSKSATATELLSESNNYSKYSLSTNNKYKVVSRIDDTVIFLNVDDTYKNEVIDILDTLGY